MGEHIRSVKVRIEVDTNKQTYTLDEDDVAPDEVETLVSDFLEGCVQ